MEVSVIRILFALAFLAVLTGVYCLVLILRTFRLRSRSQHLTEERHRLSDKLAVLNHDERNLTEYLARLDSDLARQQTELVKAVNHIDDVKTMLSDIRRNNPTTAQVMAKAMARINLDHEVGNDWEAYRTCFAKVDQRFLSALLHRVPGLHLHDLRLLCLLRLDLQHEQIAELLQITTDSVRVAKSRLRRKMGMEARQTFNEFLSEIYPEDSANSEIASTHDHESPNQS